MNATDPTQRDETNGMARVPARHEEREDMCSTDTAERGGRGTANAARPDEPRGTPLEPSEQDEQEDRDRALGKELAEQTPLPELAEDVPENERAMWVSDAEARFGDSSSDPI